MASVAHAAAPAQAAKSGTKAQPAAISRCVPAARLEPPSPNVQANFRDCQDTPEMVPLRGGEFMMGDLLGNGREYEQPVHKVRIAPFSIARYEVTAAEWQRCVDDKACEPASVPADSPRHPVSGVSWLQAQQYVIWLTRRTGRQYRLPSEAEWEYAARAASETQYSWGNGFDAAFCLANAFDLSGQAAEPAWTWAVGCDDGQAKAAPVGSYPANAWGLHDMLGNVWEWVADCWHPNYEGAPVDGRPWITEDCPKHVNRGGGWGNHPRSLRVSNRDGDRTDARSDGLGFRVAR